MTNSPGRTARSPAMPWGLEPLGPEKQQVGVGGFHAVLHAEQTVELQRHLLLRPAWADEVQQI